MQRIRDMYPGFSITEMADKLSHLKTRVDDLSGSEAERLYNALTDNWYLDISSRDSIYVESVGNHGLLDLEFHRDGHGYSIKTDNAKELLKGVHILRNYYDIPASVLIPFSDVDRDLVVLSSHAI